MREPELSLFERFINWSEAEEKNRFVWLAIAILGTIGAVLPVTLYSIVTFGNNFICWVIACAINVPVLALNLAAQPPKVTLPFLFAAWLVDIAVVVYCIITFFLIK